MSKELHQEIVLFLQEFRQEYPDAVMKLQNYTINSNVIVDVSYRGKVFVLEAAANEGYGVTEMNPYNGFTLDCDVWFQTLPEAKKYLIHQFGATEQT